MTCKVSIILPFFNAEKTLKKAIESIVNQEYSDYELILINNNSTDKSKKIALSFVEIYKNVLLFNEAQQGVVFASALGLLKASGSYIARMDADDIAFPQKINLQVNYLNQNTTIDALATVVRFESNLKSKGFQRFVNWSNSVLSTEEIFLSRFIEFPLVNPSIMFRRKSIEKFGFYENGDFPEDYELFLRWIEKGANFAKINKPLLQWNDSESRLTRTSSIYSAEKFYQIKAKYLALWLKKNKQTKIAVWGAEKRPRNRAKYLKNFGIEIVLYIDIIRDRSIPEDCVYYNEVETYRDIFIVSYIAKETARQEISAFLDSNNFKIGKDYILAG